MIWIEVIKGIRLRIRRIKRCRCFLMLRVLIDVVVFLRNMLLFIGDFCMYVLNLKGWIIFLLKIMFLVEIKIFM